MGRKLSEVVEALGRYGISCKLEGPSDQVVSGVATLEEAQPSDISFLTNNKYEKLLQTTLAGTVIVSPEQAAPAGKAVLRAQDPYAAMTAAVVFLHGYRRHAKVGIDPRAVIDATAKIGEGASIHHGVTIGPRVVVGKNAVMYPGCYVAEDCRIGDDCLLYPNVVVYDGCLLGNRVTLHSGTIIGEDGLGYAPVNGTWYKIPQVGIVEIGDDVEIGANCTIDRATLGRTVIGRGTKFSNLVAIGHGTKIGTDCMFVAQVGIAGSVHVGHHVTMAGKVGVAGHLTIGDNVELAAMSGVMKDLPSDSRYAGQPAMPIKEAMRSYSLVTRLPELHQQIKQLEAHLAELRKELDAAQQIQLRMVLGADSDDRLGDSFHFIPAN